MTTPSKNPPPILNTVVDVVLRYKPKPASNAGQKRKRKEKKIAKGK